MPDLKSTFLALGAGVALCLAQPARADVIVSLDNVVFSDGGTAFGNFGLNVLSFLTAPITMTTTIGSVLGASSYNPPVSSSVVGGPVSTTFDFSSANSDFLLQLQFVEPVGNASSGNISLVAGGGTLLGGYTGSYEECVNSAVACGVAFGTARFVTSGSADIPEPGAIGLFGLGLAAMVYVSRARSRRVVSAASA